MSPVLASARPPLEAISATVRSAAAWLMSLTTTAAPSAASASAYSRPRPPPAPVTLATRALQIPIKRPSPQPSPACGRGRNSKTLDDRYVGLAAAFAHGLQAIAAAGALELVQQRCHQLGAGCAQRVTECDRAAVHVEALVR